jgi:hypothetical protein
MPAQRKNFYPQQRKGFICQHCHATNTDHLPSPRNHCSFCLYSLHVDQDIPGDRQSICKGLMKPVALEYSGSKGYIILHECLKCKKRMKNKAAPDDNFQALIELSHV